MIFPILIKRFFLPLVQDGGPCDLCYGAGKNASGNADNLVSRRIGRFSTKLSLEDICNEVVGECDLLFSI